MHAHNKKTKNLQYFLLTLIHGVVRVLNNLKNKKLKKNHGKKSNQRLT
jgi:hypothetical protein